MTSIKLLLVSVPELHPQGTEEYKSSTLIYVTWTISLRNTKIKTHF